MADGWDDWDDWQDWGPPNRYGYYGLNCKNKPSGSGTTHSNRKAQRAHKQWSNMTIAEPDTEEGLAEQAAALEKAADKARARAEELKKRREEEEEEKDQQGASSSRGKSKGRKPRKQAALEKAAEPALEKAAPECQIRRGRRAKHGQKELLVVKEEDPTKSLEKDTSKDTATGSLEKDTSKDTATGSLEKDTSKDTGTGSLEKDTSKDTATGSLKKDTSKGTPTGSLEKDTSKDTATGSLKKDTSKKNKKRPIIVVDWHNTIERNNRVSFANEKALNLLMDKADVVILPYVESQWRESQVHQQVRELLSPSTRQKIKGVHCCYNRVGPNGKLSWCKWLSADGIMDDNNAIIQECLAGGLMAFAVMTKFCSHGNLPADVVFDDLGQAVEAFLEM
eukprot:s645_g23.t1